MDLEQIEELIEILKETEVSELNLEEDGIKINIKRGLNSNFVERKEVVSNKFENDEKENNKKTKEKEESKKDREEIVAPMVGTFYRSPSPEADPFVEVGDIVESGEVVCILEAMKLMNEIEAETKCKIINVIAEDGEAIEYGQPLFEIEKI
ncbi:MAG: acetyl-CoA carboxylase biotin carboxyl carrier protein [Bacillota bacterium]